MPDIDPCPRCANPKPVPLDKTDTERTDCYRCRTCGHIFGERKCST